MAFAGIGLRVLATDVDEATAAIATVNLRHFPDAEVRHGDGLALDLEAEGIDGVYADRSSHPMWVSTCPIWAWASNGI